MEQNILISTAVHPNDSNSSAVPVRHLRPHKLFRYAVLVAAFEVVLEVLNTQLDPMQNWARFLLNIPALLIIAPILFIYGVQENHRAAFLKQNTSISAPPDANDVDPSTILVQKAEILPSIITEAAYEAVVKALHSLPDRMCCWEDLVKASKSLFQCSHGFVSLVLENYKAWLTARNFPASTLLDVNASQLSAMFEAFESNIIEAVDSLPDEIPHRQDLINASTSLRQSFHLFNSRKPHDFHAATLASQAKCFSLRLCEVFCHPSQFAIIFLNFCSLVRSFWGGRQPGPEAILPMLSPTKRPSSRLSRLLLHHSRDLPHYERTADVSLPESSYPWTVAMIDLNAVPPEIAKGRYSTGADIYGLTSMLFLVQTLNLLLGPSWIISPLVLSKMMATWMFISTFGNGSLTLLPPAEEHHAATPAYGLLLDDEFSVILRGTQNLVEAITLRGFHFSYPVADVLQVPVRKAAVNLILEGWFQGLFYLMAILPVWRLVRPSFTSFWSQLIGTFVLLNFLPMIPSFGPLRRAVRRPNSDFLKGMVQYFVEAAAEMVRMIARAVPIVVSWFLYIHEYTVFNELQLLVDLISPLCLAFILSVPSQNYPVRTAKFLDILGNPQVKKWRFRTPAAAATFECLVFCHGIRRPVRDIDVRGVLDTVIPDQRDVWRTWKARVADRIVHEMDITFAPTLPTFHDVQLQKQLKAYLDEAQFAYDAYCRWSVGLTDKGSVPRVPLLQHPAT